MKINKREFDLLTREADVVQEIDEKKISIFFMTPDEEDIYNVSGRYAIWTSDGKEYKLLINKEYYEYGEIQHFYNEGVNAKWLGYVEKMSKLQRKTLLTIMLPIMVIYIGVAILAITLFKDYALYILIGLMVIIFIVNYFQNKMIRTKMQAENDAVQLEIQELLGEDVYDKIAYDQAAFRKMKNPEPVEPEFVEESEVIEETTEEVIEEQVEVEKEEDISEEK